MIRYVANSKSVCENTTSSTKPEVRNYRIVVRAGKATTTDNVYRKFREVWTCGF